MPKALNDRILYYVTKANEFVDAVRVSKANKYRQQRLVQYKQAIYERADVSGNK